MNETKIKDLYRTDIYSALLNGEQTKVNELLDNLKKDLSDSYKKE